MIISASRRTDIPAYYAKWMLERLKAGAVSIRNPFNPKQFREIILSPDKIECIVFWTKNPAPMLPLLHEIDAMGYRYYFQFTLTPYDRTIEKYLPPKTELIRTFRQLSEQIGKQKIVWRYGNPATHGMGKAPSGYHDDGDQVLFGSHDVEWLPNGNISIFNNGTHRPSANRSSVMEINPATNQVVWQYETKDHNSFYSDFQSAAQKLPNGNWFITSTNNGHLFEVTPDKQVVWEYNNPISTDDQAYCVKRDDNPETQVHRAYRYGKDFPAFAGKDLKPQGKLAAGCPDWHLLLEFRQGPNFSSK